MELIHRGTPRRLSLLFCFLYVVFPCGCRMAAVSVCLCCVMLWICVSGLTSRLNPAHGSASPAVTPVIAPVPRRDSLEMRGRANSSLNGESHGLERVVDSIRIENNEYRKLIKELDDRCTSPTSSYPRPMRSLCYWIYHIALLPPLSSQFLNL